MQETKETRSMFLTRALGRMLADKDLKRSHNTQLRKACQVALDDVKEDLKNMGDGPAKSPYTIIEADRYFLAFDMACKSRSPSIVGIALDCLQKMIAYGILVGNAPDSTQPGKRLIDRVIDTICLCFNGVQTDENVQLQIIKVLLTAVTSNSCEVHEGTILQAVRTCYNIYLASRNIVNQTTAKATLSQMLNVIFSRMESQATVDEELLQKIEQEDKKELEEDTNEKGINGEAVDKTEGSDEGAHAEDFIPLKQDEAPESDQHQTKLIPECEVENDTLERETVIDQPPDDSNTEEKENDQDDNESDHIVIENGKTESEDGMAQEHHEKVGNGVVKSETAESMVRGILDDMVDKIVISHRNGGRKESNTSQDTSASSNVSRQHQLEQQLYHSQSFSHILQKDAFLVFRSLCKLSMKPLSEGPPDPKSHELRSKILSLQLLLSILQSSGTVFRTNEMFINAIKQYLCVALSKNGVSNVPEVFELSLAIFLKLLENFKTHLKMQIQVFFKEIFLNIIETSSSSFEHKWMVLQTLGKICEDAQSVVDIYVNYDCDINAANIFEQLINVLSKIAQHNHPESNYTVVQEHSMRTKSLHCLVSILRCMVEWSKDLYVNPHLMSNLGKEHNPDGATASVPLSSTSSSNSIHESSQSVHSDSSSEHAGIANSSFGSVQNNANTSSDNPETIEGIKQQKSILEQGIHMFNVKPKKGISFLQDQGMLGTSAKDIAEFLSSEGRLSPAQVGDFLGENESLNKEVMYAYVDLLNFSEVDFVPALRMFLEGFRLPGEAQKIDRLMEKFASRYCDCNPKDSVFASADTAYVLAYSIIMLTTDLHSAQVKRKISMEDYIKMNRGINDSKDLPPAYLEDIYEQIKRQEITLKPTRAQSVKGNKALSAVQKKQEMNNIAVTAKALMEAVSHVQSSFISTKRYEHVKPMFQLSWRSMVVAFSMGLQDSDDEKIVHRCLDGMRCAIRIACIFQLPLERDTFVQALSRFSLLQANAGIREMKAKNIDSIKTLINVAYTDGNYLEESWHEILQCVSQLELLQLIGSKVRDHTTASMKSVRSGSVIDTTPILNKTFGMEQKKLASIQESMGETSSQSVVVAVDRIFTGSTRLDGDGIVDFVRWLSKVSLDELSNQINPRMFCLQKIVEITYYNMGRIRIQWSRIWAILGDYFNAVGCNDEESIAFFAVDSLRQLSMKFLEKGELPGFSFQKDFLRPFEHIMKHHTSPVIQDMVVRCIAQMVSSQANNIKSGWKNIFAVFSMAAAHPDENIVELAFHTTSTVITDIFNMYFQSIIYCFQDAISALREFSCCAFPDTSMEAIRLIRQCADYVAQRPDFFEKHFSEEAVGRQLDGDNVWVRGWFPILFELSIIISRCKLDVRTRGLTVMFEIMKTHGSAFQTSWWTDLFQIIFRIFDQMKVPELQLEKSDWFATTCNHALFAVCDVFTQYYETLAPTLLPDVYGQLLWCVEKENEQLARSGVNCLENLILSNGTKFNKGMWKLTCETIQQVFKMVAADKLMSWKPGIDDVAELQNLQLNCILTAEMIECIDRMLFYPTSTRRDDEYNVTLALSHSMQINAEVRHKDEMFSQMSENHLFVMVRCLLVAHDFAKRFNGDNEQRTILWKAGFKGKSKPNLIRQECSSLACTLRILFRMKEQKETAERVDALLYSVCLNALSYFASLSSESHRDAWTSVLLLLLVRILRLPEDSFFTLTRKLHTPICDLLLFELKQEVRFLLRRYFLKCNDFPETHNNA